MRARTAACLLLCLAWPGPSHGQVTVKMATLAPDGSAWHQVLEEMAHEWKEATQGRVELKIYAGGVAGDDPFMLRKIRIGQLHGGALTIAGLTDIDSAFNVFSIPLFFESYEEYLYVLEKMTPELEKRLDAQDFVLLHWGHGGWAHLFSKKPVRTVEELKALKVFTWAGEDRMAEIWRSNGFKPVALASTDILTALQTGLIEGIPTTPLAVLSLQWYRQVPYMMDEGIAPLLGGTIISKKAWLRIAEGDRALLLAAARRAERRLAEEIPVKDAQAVEEMRRRNLTVTPMPVGEELERWKAVGDAFAEGMRREFVSEDVFAMAMRHRSEYRKRSSGKAPD